MIHNFFHVFSDFLTGFQRNPIDVQETTELHKQLFSALYREFSVTGVKFELERSRLGMKIQPDRKLVRINPVRTAYPPHEKFDIAILDWGVASPTARVEADDFERGAKPRAVVLPTPDNYQAYWQQPLCFALNLHLCLREDHVPKYLKSQQEDLRKMAAYREKLPCPDKFIGISLMLVDAYLEKPPGPEVNFSLEPGLAAWIVTPDITYRHDCS